MRTLFSGLWWRRVFLLSMLQGSWVMPCSLAKSAQNVIPTEARQFYGGRRILNASRKSSLENPFDARISYAEYFQGNENSFIRLPCRSCGISGLATAYSVVVLRQSPLHKAASMILSMFESTTPLSERLFLA